MKAVNIISIIGGGAIAVRKPILLIG